MYHCTPSELAAQDAADILAHLECMRVEARINAAREKRAERQHTLPDDRNIFE